VLEATSPEAAPLEAAPLEATPLEVASLEAASLETTAPLKSAPGEATAENECNGTWLDKMIKRYSSIRRVSDSVGDIQLSSYFAAVEETAGIYDILFSSAVVRGQLKKDLGSNLNEVKERLELTGWSAEDTTLRELLQHDLGLIGIDGCRLHRKRSAIWGALWVNRASRFILSVLRGFVSGKTGKEAAAVAYEELSVYHGLLTRKFVGMAMTVASISKDDLIRKLEMPDEATTLGKCSEFLAVGQPLVNDIIALMEELGTNFPDRM
jgi:hypothetical protein